MCRERQTVTYCYLRTFQPGIWKVPHLVPQLTRQRKAADHESPSSRLSRFSHAGPSIPSSIPPESDQQPHTTADGQGFHRRSIDGSTRSARGARRAPGPGGGYASAPPRVHRRPRLRHPALPRHTQPKPDYRLLLRELDLQMPEQPVPRIASLVRVRCRRDATRKQKCRFPRRGMELRVTVAGQHVRASWWIRSRGSLSNFRYFSATISPSSSACMSNPW